MNNHIDKGQGFTHHDDSGCCACPCKEPSNKWEEAVRQQIAKIMVDYGVDFYEGNLMHRTEQRLSLIEDFQNDIVTALTNAVKELVETAKPERPGVNKGTNDPLENKIEGFALGIDDYQANLLKAIGDKK